MQNSYPTLSKAPIKEAIIDIQVAFEKDISLDSIQLINDEIREDFPIRENKYKWTTGFKLQGAVPQISEHSGSQIGFMFKSADNTKVLQATVEGFTFNKLPPYLTWDSFSKEAKSLWNIYLEKLKPSKINRIGLRYINRIEIPLPIRELKDYILTCPDIAPNLPNALSNLLMRLEIPVSESEAMVIITESIDKVVGGAQEPKLPLIYDIDVIKILSIDSKDPIVWDYYEELRNIKNKFFFNSNTDKTKELLK